MSKFTVEERKHLKQLVREAIVRRFSNREAVTHIKKELGQDITIKQITRIKKDIRNEASEWVSSLARTDNAYIYVYNEDT